MTRRSAPAGWRAGAAVAAILLTATACGGSASGAGVPAAAGRLGGAGAVPAPVVAAPPPAAAPSPTAAPSPRSYTASELKALLLTEADLPSVFSVDNSPSEDDSGISSPTSRCDALARIINADTTGDATVEAEVAFDGGSTAPLLSEDLAAMPSAASASAYVTSVRDAAGTCDRLRADLDAGSVPLSVSSAAAASVGEQRFAFELTASSSDGDITLSVQLISAGSVVLVTTGDDATNEDMSAFTSDAYAKLTGGSVPPGGHVSGRSRSGGGSGGGGGGSGGGGGGSSSGSGGQPA